MNIHTAIAIAFELVLIPACLSAAFLLLLFGIVVAPAVFPKPERAERARKILSDLLPWVPFFGLLVRSRRGSRIGGSEEEVRAKPATTGDHRMLQPHDER